MDATPARLAPRDAAAPGVQALLVDGTVVTIRPTSPQDADALRALHRGVSQVAPYQATHALRRQLRDAT